MLFLTFMAVVGGIACSAPSSGSAVPDDAVRLLLQRDDGFVHIFALFEAHPGTPDSLRYELEVLREGPAGRSKTTQGGTFIPQRAHDDTLSVTRISVSDGDRIQALLRLYDDEQLVGEARHDGVF